MSILASVCAICTQCACSAHAVRTQCEILAFAEFAEGEKMQFFVLNPLVQVSCSISTIRFRN